MVLLQPKLHLKVSQRQILTPGLVQMVSVLALNKLELKDMINAEMVENPVLEELEDSVPLIDDVGRREEERERVSSVSEEAPTASTDEKKDSFEEIDFGSFFKDYLDPGFRSPGDFEEIERPSFENFLSKPSTLTDHLMWQLGAVSTRPAVREAAEVIIGNLNEDGYLIASDEELLGIVAPSSPEDDAAKAERLVKEAAALGLQAVADASADLADVPDTSLEPEAIDALISSAADDFDGTGEIAPLSSASYSGNGDLSSLVGGTVANAHVPEPPAQLVSEPAAPEKAPAATPKASASNNGTRLTYKPSFNPEDLHEAIEVIRQLDPPGVACRDLRDCLLYQLRYHQAQLERLANGNGNGNGTAQVLADA